MPSLMQQIKKLFDTPSNNEENPINNIAFFSQLSSKEKRLLISLLHRRCFEMNEEIFRENSPATAAYFVIQGSVGLYKAKDDGIQDRVHYVSQGRCFGCSALLEETSALTSARALESTSVFVLLRNDFLSLIEAQPEIANKILISVGKELFTELAESRTEFLVLTHRLTNANIVV